MKIYHSKCDHAVWFKYSFFSSFTLVLSNVHNRTSARDGPMFGSKGPSMNTSSLAWSTASISSSANASHLGSFLARMEDRTEQRKAVLRSESSQHGFQPPQCKAWIGLGTEFRFEKIPRNRLGMISVIPRKKAFIPRHYEFRGRANSEARNGTERNGIPRKKLVLRNSSKIT